MSNKISRLTSRGWHLALLVAATILVFGMGSEVQAQCPATGNCPNQVIAANPNTPYQLDPRTKVRKVLLYDQAPSHNAGKQAIRRAMSTMAVKYGFELTINDGAIGWINPTRLQGMDLVMLSQGDCDVVQPPNSVSDSAMQNYIYRDGGSLLMMHAAAAFISCPGTGTGGSCGTGGHNIADANCRFLGRAAARQYYHHQSAGSPARIYVDSVFAGQVPPHQTCTGAPTNNPTACTGTAPHTAVPPIATINHGKSSAETRNIFNNAIPFNWALPPNSATDSRTFVWDNLADEWYEYYNNPGPRAIQPSQRVWNGVTYTEDRLNILLSMDETSRYLGSQRMGDHPQSWVRKMGNGLAAYNNIGHDNTPYSAIRAGTGLSAYDSLSHAYLWNLVRFLARDFQGCTKTNFTEYVPWASVDSLTPADGNPCQTPTAIVSPANGSQIAQGVGVSGNMIRIETPNAGYYRVLISDMLGRQVFVKTVMGGANRTVEVPNLAKASYSVHITQPSKAVKVVQVQL